MNMSSKNSKAMTIAIVAGVLLIIAGVNGVATWETIKSFVTENITDNSIVQVIFALLIFIASLGGIAVIIGGILIGKDNVKLGKFIIAVGVGMGLIGFIFTLIIAFLEENLTFAGFLSIGTIGLILSIAARALAEKK